MLLQRLVEVGAIEACYSVAGEPSYLLKVQVPTMAGIAAPSAGVVSGFRPA